MIKKLLTLIYLTLFFVPIKAEVLKELIIEGNKRISVETIKVYGDIKINKDYSEEDINKILTGLYSTNFFKNIELDFKNNKLKILVEEFPLVNQIIISGEDKKSLNEQIKKLIQLKENQSFIKSYLVQDVETIKQLYSSIGYNFANVEAKINKINNENFDLLFVINRGNKTKISTISFVGNKSIRSKKLKDIVASEEDKFWKFLSRNTSFSENLIRLDERLLTNYYKSLGFYDVKINSNLAQINEKSGLVDISYNISEGSRYYIGKISTNVDDVFDKKLFFPLNEIFSKYAGDYYSPFKVKQILEELDLIIEKNNLQFVEHNVREVVAKDKINIVLNVFEGEKKLVERIDITGNSITNESVIRGELILDEGDPFVKLNLDKSVANLKERNIFEDVEYEVKNGSKENLKIINLTVKEKPTGEISAGAGIGTSGGMVAFTVKENNWLGEGKALSFDLELDQESVAGTFSFVDPNHDFLGNTLRYSLSSERNDKPNQGYENAIVSASVGTSFEQYRNTEIGLGLRASYDDLETTDDASEALQNQAGTFSELSANYGITLDERNRSFMPTSGSIFNFSQAIPIYADKSFIANTVSSSTYKSFSEDVVGSGKIFLSSVNGLGDDDVRLSRRQSLSNKRLRGFERGKVGPVDDKDHIGGNYAAALNLETNLPNLLPEDTNADISLFLDFGNVWGVDYDDTLDESNTIRSSTGLSVNWTSPVGPMTFVFSQNLRKADTDSIETFTFNLGTTF